MSKEDLTGTKFDDQKKTRRAPRHNDEQCRTVLAERTTDFSPASISLRKGIGERKRAHV